MPSLKKTKNLRLSQWAGNEYVSFNDIAEDNAKIDMAIGNKVDKEEGKGLSSNDYTNEDKAKLDGIDAQLSNIGETMIPLLSNISDGKVDKEEGKGLSTNDFTNDYKNKLDTMEETFSNLCNATMQNTSSSLLESVSSFVQSKVDKVSGKDLSSNDYTNADKNKVSNLPANTLEELNNLKQSVVSGKNTIATAINDISGSNVANSNMTHSDLAVAIRNNLVGIKRIFKNGSQLSSGVRMVLRAFSTNRWTGFTYTESDINKYGSLSNNEIIIKGTWTGQGIVIFTNYIDFRNFNDLLVKYELTESAKGFVEIGVLSSIPSLKKQGESLIEKPTFARSAKAGNTLESALVSLKGISGGYIGIVGGSEQYEAITKILEISLLKS